MFRERACHNHPDRALMAYCNYCSRPFCRDCATELLGDYYCATCKTRIAQQREQSAVLPDAQRAALMASVGLLMAGFLVGPYALNRAQNAAQLSARTPWLRGRWHLRAAYALGGIATLIGLLTLWGWIQR